MGHNSAYGSGGHAESNHISERIHLNTVQTCGVKNSGGEAVEDVKYHGAYNYPCAGSEYSEGSVLRHFVDLQHINDGDESAYRVAQSERIRHHFQIIIEV